MTTSIDLPLRGFAAGSLQAVLRDRGGPFEWVFGGAGLLRERVESGEPCDLFLSADLAHPRMLAARIPGALAKTYIRNQIVVAARAEIGLSSENFVDRLLDPAVRIATSTPGTDPGGDWALELFRRADQIRPGAAGTLTAKAMHLVGGREPPQLPAGSHPVAHFLATGAADAFVCYRSMTLDLDAHFAAVLPPAAMQVAAEYGLVVLATDPVRRAIAAKFADALTSPEWQARFDSHGFDRI